MLTLAVREPGPPSAPFPEAWLPSPPSLFSRGERSLTPAPFLPASLVWPSQDIGGPGTPGVDSEAHWP